MVVTLIHRGPDQQGTFSSDLFSLGGARLKIIDLESGNQPILHHGGECGIVFNGEIYNHLELRADLEKLGHQFTSHSDTKILLKAFLHWDTECFARLRGMFFAYYSDEPSADAGALPVWYLSKLCKTKTTVALSGEGADELFGGYLTYRANRISRILRGFPDAVLSTGVSLLRHWPISDEKIGFEYIAKRLLDGSRMSPERAHVYWNGTFADHEKSTILNESLPGTLEEILGQLPKLPKVDDDLAPFLWLDQKYYLADDILTKSDRMSMAHSVEVRPPFLDHRIVEFAATLPAKFKIQGFTQKVVLRKLMQDKLPHEILNRKKVGFDIPAHDWLRGSLRPLLEDALEFGLTHYGQLFCRDGIESLKKRHFQREINVGYPLWGLLILFLWMKRWQATI